MRKHITLPITVILLYGASVVLNASFRERLLPAGREADIIQKMCGGLRIFVGDWAFMKAEEYHHRGLPFESAHAYHEGEALFTGEEHREEHGGANEAVSGGDSLYQKIYSEVKITSDSHLKPEEEKEVLPWFYVEAAFNPHDIRGYVMGAFWLERIGRRDEGLKFLEAGEKNNPDSAQILGAIGSFYFKTKDYDRAASYLERAARLWEEASGPNIVTNKYEESDRLFTFKLLAALRKELLKFSPDSAIVERTNRSRRGQTLKGLTPINP